MHKSLRWSGWRDPGSSVAALIDLAGMKAAVVTQRAELRDYLDIHVLMTKAKISLAEMLAAGSRHLRGTIQPVAPAQGHRLSQRPVPRGAEEDVRQDLIEVVKATDPRCSPVLNVVRTREAEA